jgi:hypothetical protein
MLIKDFVENQFNAKFGKTSEEVFFIYVGKQLDL